MSQNGSERVESSPGCLLKGQRPARILPKLARQARHARKAASSTSISVWPSHTLLSSGDLPMVPACMFHRLACLRAGDAASSGTRDREVLCARPAYLSALTRSARRPAARASSVTAANRLLRFSPSRSQTPRCRSSPKVLVLQPTDLSSSTFRSLSLLEQKRHVL